MTNSAAIGYAIRALQKLGYTKEEIKKGEYMMKELMDLLTEEQAENIYRKF